MKFTERKENIMRTDTERLDFLQQLTNRKKYTGKVILRESTTGRGWRLHEHSGDGAVESVRDAIDAYEAEIKTKGGKNGKY
ncbi:MAG: hypothetical protein SVO01_00390 [Thermotogota bacterium]|nr:hypothetical protein [Thermotogota bacterium]